MIPEIVASDCNEILVWHSGAVKPDLSRDGHVSARPL